jgi:hypothetical protein
MRKKTDLLHQITSPKNGLKKVSNSKHPEAYKHVNMKVLYRGDLFMVSTTEQDDKTLNSDEYSKFKRYRHSHED